MKYPKKIRQLFDSLLYFYHKLTGIYNQKTLIKSIRSEVPIEGRNLAQRDFFAISKRNKTMAEGYVMVGRFQEYKYHYCIFNGTEVKPLYRRRQLGHKLVLARLRFCEKEGFDYVIVPVKATNLASQAMLRKSGFRFPAIKD
jgi:L-amino acid N-acyltransferase YncA